MHELTVEWLLPDGRGAGRTSDGTVVRLWGGLPGDTVAFTPGRGSGRHIDGVLDHIVSPAPTRRQSPCRFSEGCGGCDLDELPIEAQHDALAHTVARAFRREELPPIVPSPRSEGHRARIKVHIEGGQVGYRAPRSHDLTPIEDCRIARAEVQAALQALREWLHSDASRGQGLDSVELRSDGHRCVYAFSSDGRASRQSRASSMGLLGDVALDGKAIAGNPTLQLEVQGVTLRVSPRSFYQVNLEANELLSEFVSEQVLAAAPERVLDLYAGIGNLSLPLAASGVPIVAVESEGQAIGDLKHAAEAWPHVTAIVSRVERFDPSTQAFDVVVLDPPRTGARGVLAKVVRNRPRRIVYVSCHAPSAARDLREIDGQGYQITAVRCFDLFPDTHHIETVVVLERSA